jgi:hypothetical protein
MLSGTIRDGIGEKLRGSEGQKTEIFLKEFELEDAFSLLGQLQEQGVISDPKKRLFGNSEMIRSLAIVGLLPRALEIFIESFNDYLKQPVASHIIASMSQKISRYYSFGKSVSLLSSSSIIELLQLCILKAPVMKSKELTNSANQPIALEYLESNGYLLLEAVTDSTFTINLPYIWLMFFLQVPNVIDGEGMRYLQFALDELVQIVGPASSASPYHFEMFCAYYEIAYIQMYMKVHAKTKISMKDLWPNMQAKNPIFDEKFDLSGIDFCRCQTIFPKHKTEASTVFGLNAPKAPFDAFIRIKDKVIARQYKHTLIEFNESRLTQSVVANENKRTRESLKSSNYDYKGLIFLTNRPLNKNITDKYLESTQVALFHKDNLNQFFITSLVRFLRYSGMLY